MPGRAAAHEGSSVDEDIPPDYRLDGIVGTAGRVARSKAQRKCRWSCACRGVIPGRDAARAAPKEPR